MKNLLMGAGIAALAAPAFADEPRLTFEGELEVGVNSVISSDDPTAELNDAFATVEISVAYELSDVISLFAGLTLESVTDPTDDRAFEDMALYVNELGLAFDFEAVSVSVGKITPAFGVAWDAAPGFFGADFTEDYELTEGLGAVVAFDVGPGRLSASLFYLDDTALSRSLGTDRGRRRVAAGGVGNTGKFDNFALQYDFDAGATIYSLSGSLLSAGVGNAEDQKGAAIGAVHALTENIELVGEVAYFDGLGGTAVSANYLTVGGTYARGPFTYAASYTRRDVSNASADHLVSVGLDYTFANDITLSSGIGFAREGGVDAKKLGLSVIIPFGS